jgi:opacity protein-like surface antigen
MKRIFIMIAGCALLLSTSSIAECAEGPYMSGNLGFSVLSDSDWTDTTLPGITINLESDTGYALGLAVGSSIGPNVRVEGEVAYQKNDLDKASLFGIDLPLSGDTTNLAFLLNCYYDFANTSPLTPFLSAGLGIARFDVNDFNFPGSGLPDTNENSTEFAYQLGAGLGYAVSEALTIDLKYRYFGTSDPEIDTSTFTYASHNFYAGLRVNF